MDSHKSADTNLYPSQCLKQLQEIKKTYYVAKKIANIKYGAIYQLLDKKYNQEVCAKVINRNEVCKVKNGEQNFSNELIHMAKLDHPNIVKFYEHFQDSDNFYIIMEYFDKLFSQWKKQKKVFLEEEVIQIMKSLVSALTTMHANQIIHGNLTLDSLVWVEETQSIKISDFSVSKDMDSQMQWSRLFYLQSNSDVDETLLLAPEVTESKHYGYESDVYSLGVILYQLVYLDDIPFAGSKNKDKKENKMKGVLDFESRKLKVKFSDSVNELIRKLLEPDPKKRLKLSGILNEQFFSPKNQDQLSTSKIQLQNQKINEFMNQRIFKSKEQPVNNEPPINKQQDPNNSSSRPVKSQSDTIHSSFQPKPVDKPSTQEEVKSTQVENNMVDISDYSIGQFDISNSLSQLRQTSSNIKQENSQATQPQKTEPVMQSQDIKQENSQATQPQKNEPVLQSQDIKSENSQATQPQKTEPALQSQVKGEASEEIKKNQIENQHKEVEKQLGDQEDRLADKRQSADTQQFQQQISCQEQDHSVSVNTKTKTQDQGEQSNQQLLPSSQPADIQQQPDTLDLNR